MHRRFVRPGRPPLARRLEPLPVVPGSQLSFSGVALVELVNVVCEKAVTAPYSSCSIIYTKATATIITRNEIFSQRPSGARRFSPNQIAKRKRLLFGGLSYAALPNQPGDTETSRSIRPPCGNPLPLEAANDFPLNASLLQNFRIEALPLGRVVSDETSGSELRHAVDTLPYILHVVQHFTANYEIEPFPAGNIVKLRDVSDLEDRGMATRPCPRNRYWAYVDTVEAVTDASKDGRMQSLATTKFQNGGKVTKLPTDYRVRCFKTSPFLLTIKIPRIADPVQDV